MFKLDHNQANPTGNFLLFEEIKPKSKSQILTPNGYDEGFRLMWGRVLRVGPGPLTSEGGRGQMISSEGDIICFIPTGPPGSQFSAPIPVEVEGKDKCFLIMENYVHMTYSGEIEEDSAIPENAPALVTTTGNELPHHEAQ